jgi:hypothetical protein
LSEAMEGSLPDPDQALGGVANSTDPVERVAMAAEHLARHVLARAGAVRAMIAATIVRPEDATSRPGLRFGLIDHALRPWSESADPETLIQLERDLSVVISSEALFSLMDLGGLEPDDAVATIVHAATTLTRAALAQ